jgi:hypothetical protein
MFRSQMIPTYALSLKQPWATLLVHGLKTIEVRRWPTIRQGRILIHAGRIADDRPGSWKHVPARLREYTEHLGGIIGAAKITGCRRYHTLEDFLKDQPGHLNEADWFEEAVLYGFTFTDPEILPFREYPGWMRFFPVGAGPFVRRRIPAPKSGSGS